MTIVTDCHSAYFALHFLNHQVCLSHLLRELQYLSELEAKQDWSEKVEALLKCRDYIFNFLRTPAIPPDNDASEKEICKLKIKLKNSCTFRSDLGADAFLELHSIVKTAKKHKQMPYHAIQTLF